MARTRKHADHSSRNWVGAALAFILLIAALAFLPLHDWADSLEGWLEGMGPLGILLFAVLYIVVTLTLLPAWILSVVAGAVFGIFGGFLLSWSASLVGAALAFLIARYAVRDRVKRYFARHKTLAAVDKALHKGGWKVVAMLRLSPVIPFTVQNYFFGATTVSLAQFMVGTALGTIAGTLVEAWVGATGRAASGGGTPAQWSLLGVGIAATVAVTWYVGKAAKKRLGIT